MDFLKPSSYYWWNVALTLRPRVKAALYSRSSYHVHPQYSPGLALLYFRIFSELKRQHGWLRIYSRSEHGSFVWWFHPLQRASMLPFMTSRFVVTRIHRLISLLCREMNGRWHCYFRRRTLCLVYVPSVLYCYVHILPCVYIVFCVLFLLNQENNTYKYFFLIVYNAPCPQIYHTTSHYSI